MASEPGMNRKSIKKYLVISEKKFLWRCWFARISCHEFNEKARSRKENFFGHLNAILSSDIRLLKTHLTTRSVFPSCFEDCVVAGTLRQAQNATASKGSQGFGTLLFFFLLLRKLPDPFFGFSSRTLLSSHILILSGYNHKVT